MSRVTNWAHTYSATPRVFTPIATQDDLFAALAAAREDNAGVRVLGAAQSPSDIAMSDDHLLVIRGLDRISEIDRDRCEVVAEAGITLAALAAALDPHGLALPSLGSIIDQTLGGAAATGAHGTGLAFGSSSTWIKTFDMLTINGELLHATPTQNLDLFAGGRISLGSLGVHTAFRLKVVPAFDLRVEQGPIPLETALAPEWYSSADHARVWYLPHVQHAWGWRAFRIPRPAGVPRKSGPSPGLLQQLRQRALGYQAFQAGLWLAASFPRLLPSVNRAYAGAFFSQPGFSTGDSVQQFILDCLFHQRVTEWAVPLAAVAQAVLGTRDLVNHGRYQAHLPIEIRFTAGDDLWLSPTHGGPRCWIGIVAYLPYGREVDWKPWFAAFEDHMLNSGGRPHWAKQFAVRGPQLHALYPRWANFEQLRARMDPQRRLRNAYTERVFE